MNRIAYWLPVAAALLGCSSADRADAEDLGSLALELETKGVTFEEHDATHAPEVRQEMIARAGRNTFPQIFINDRHVGGCDDLHALERAGELDALLAA